MQFVEKLEYKEYKKFWESVDNNHFLQSYGWGIAQEKNRGLEPCYVGMKNDKGKLVAAALLLKRKLPMNNCFFYVPRGFSIDYNNKELLSEFTKFLKEYLKKQNAIYLKIDPPIMYQELDSEANIVPNGKNNYELYEIFKSLGYKHKGFNKLYEGNQPRYTFRTYFKKYASFDDVIKTFSSSFYRPVKRSYAYDVEIYEANEIDTFYELIKMVSKKDNFHEYSYDYYNNVCKCLDKNEVKIFNARINPSKIIEKFENDIKNEKNEDRKVKIQKDIDYFKEVVKTHPEEYVCGSLICTYTNTGSWSLYIGNDDVALYTGIVNRLYYEYIKDAYDRGFEYADLFGVVGDPKTKYKNLAGIYEYKRKIGGELIEFIGEFDLVNKPIKYAILPLALKIYRSIRRK